MRVYVVSISTIGLLAATAASVFPATPAAGPRLPMNSAPQAHPSSQSAVSPAPKPARPVPSITVQQAHDAVVELRARHLLLPIQGFNPESIKGSFYESRGTEMHKASDMLAPRNTPILAVEDGTIAKLWTSKAGGITIYQFDPAKRYIYYYAHLENYAADLKDGDVVKRGQVIGFVGTSGNAPPNTPHLHFSISVVTEPGRWWSGAQIDPYEVYSNNGPSEQPAIPSEPRHDMPRPQSGPKNTSPRLPDKVRIYEI